MPGPGGAGYPPPPPPAAQPPPPAPGPPAGRRRPGGPRGRAPGGGRAAGGRAAPARAARRPPAPRARRSAATRRSPSRPGGDAPRRSRSGDANRRSRSGSEAPAPAPLFAFLRAVNLGKVNKVPMAKLMELLAARGFPPTGYLLASGNLAVQAPASDAPELRRELVRAIAEGFDVRTEVVFKTAAEVARLVREEPLRKAGW